MKIHLKIHLVVQHVLNNGKRNIERRRSHQDMIPLNKEIHGEKENSKRNQQNKLGKIPKEKLAPKRQKKTEEIDNKTQ